MAPNPFRLAVRSWCWTPTLQSWLNKLPKNTWKDLGDPYRIPGEDCDYYYYEFDNKEDATAFKITFHDAVV